MKKFLSSILFLFVLLVSSCTPKRVDKIFDVTWTCSIPIIEIVVLEEDEVYAANGINYGYIMKGNEKIELVCLWTTTREIDAFYKDKVDIESNIFNENEIAFSGRYSYNGSSLKVTLKVDNVYNFQYKTFTFTKK